VSVREAPLEDNGSGLAPAGAGWFVVNVRDAQWLTSEGGEKRPSGAECSFESAKAEFAELGIRLHVLTPGEPNGLYHTESKQEDFLVLAGECTLLVEGEERVLRQWDFFHCPPQTEHIFVGAGDGPCVILMAGAREGDWSVHYPASELAARYGASVEEATSDPREAYTKAGFEPSRRERPSYWNRLPWAVALALLLAVVTAASAAAATSPTLVSFRQTGGFAGFDRGFAVKRTGALVPDGMPLKKAHLTATELSKLRLALVNARFATLAKAYRPDEPIADGFTYGITYAGRRVTIEQGGKPPLRLQRVFDLLRRLARG
jgi:uncharacterized cupin superfamily protein